MKKWERCKRAEPEYEQHRHDVADLDQWLNEGGGDACDAALLQRLKAEEVRCQQLAKRKLISDLPQE